MCAIVMVLLLLISGYGVASVPKALGELVAEDGRVVSVTSPDLPLEVGQPVPEALFGGDDLQIGDYRYVPVLISCTGSGRWSACSSKVSVLDPDEQEVAKHPIPGVITGTAQFADHLYLTWHTPDLLTAGCSLPGGGLHVLDISDPADPLLVGDCPLPGWSTDLQGKQPFVYVLTTCGLHIFGISQPDDLREVGSLAWEGVVPVESVLDATTLYVMWVDYGYGTLPTLSAIDLSDPAHPVDIGWEVTLSGRTGVLATQHMAIIDGVLLVPTGEFTWYGYRLP